MTKRRLAKRQQRTQRLLQIYNLHDNKCQHCGYESYAVGFFDFHHIDPSEKETNIGRIIFCRWEIVAEELAKCLMLCPNCHRLEHIRIREEAYIDEFEYGNIDPELGRG